jgi:DNA-binding MarR family transcriptional regulator
MKEAVKLRGCTNLKLRQFSRVVTRHYDAYLATSGLKNTQYALLSHIVSLGPVRPSDLAKRLRMDTSTLSRNLHPLMVQGWVRLGPGQDARSRLVQATEAGRAKRAQARQAWKQAQLSINARLGAKRVAELHALIDDCVGRLADADVNDEEHDGRGSKLARANSSHEGD